MATEAGEMVLSNKQDQIARSIAAGKKKILLEGAIGTSKTYGFAVCFLTIAMQWPGSVIGIGRKNKPELRKGTLLSFREAAYDMGLVKGYHYKENKVELYFEFLREAKGSFIYFVEMDHTKDPQFFKLKGMNLSCAGIDEADGVIASGRDMLYSRTGRNNKNGCPDFLLMTCNANEGDLKTDYYDKYHEPEKHGELPKDCAVIEFELEDSFLPDSYYLKQMSNPPQWIRRYLYNDWNYGDDLYSLFKYRHMDSIHVPTFIRGTKTLAIDAARVTDRTAGACWEGSTLVDIVIFKDRNKEMDYKDQARLIHRYCVKHGIGWQNIWVDAVGEGQGLITALDTLYNWKVNSFVSNAKPESKIKSEMELKRATDNYQRQAIQRRNPIVYADLRSEQIYLLSTEIEQGDTQFYDGCPYLAEFKKEATMHNHKDDKVMRVESKQQVKERTGHSPDIFDCVLMGYYGSKRSKAIGSYGSRRRGSKSQSPAPETKRIRGDGKPVTRGWRGAKF